MITIVFWLSIATIIYIYLGYPVILTLLAFVRPPQKSFPHSTPFITLLIAAYNEENVIAQKIDNSLSLNYPKNRLQIIVAADGSNDSTPDIVLSYAHLGVELVYKPNRRGKMAAINNALSFAKGNIVIFSDANNMYTNNVLRDLVAPFADPTVGAVSGAKSIVKGDSALGESEGLYWKYESFIKKQETRLGSSSSVVGEVWAIRASLIEPYPEKIINDDFYMAMRLMIKGYRIIYVPEARSFERISFSAKDEFLRRSRIVAGRYQALLLLHKLIPKTGPILMWQIISHKFMRPLIPLAMLCALLSNTASVIWSSDNSGSLLFNLSSPFNWIILLFQMLFYGFAVIGNYFKFDHKWFQLLYLPSFLLNSNISAIVGLYLFLKNSQSTSWCRVERRKMISSSNLSKRK